MSCRTGCPAQNHGSWGECARAANIRSMYLGGTTSSWGDEKRFRRENENFRQAVADGLQPAAVSNRAVNRAYDAAAAGS